MNGIIRKMTNWWISLKIIEKDDEDIYEYGLELMLHTVLNLSAILVSAALLGKTLENLVLLMVVIPLQLHGGGYHAKTHLRCFLIMYIGWWSITYALPYIHPTMATVMAIISIMVVYKLAPVPHVNVKMSEEQRLRMRRIARIIVVSVAFISTLTTWVISVRMGIVMSVGLGVVSFSMLAAYGKNMLLHLKHES